MCINDGRLKRGIILKGIGGFYYVLSDGVEFETRACGRFRNDGIKPIPGDRVLFTAPTDVSGGVVEEVLERKNSLVRPLAANVDLLIIVLAAGSPAPDLLLVDKLLLYARYNEIPSALVINKLDQSEAKADDVATQYSGATNVLTVSAQTGEGLAGFKTLLHGKTACLAGQSAVGKSSLINALSPGLSLETGGLSKKTARGKHTTRHSELIYLPEADATVIDTPGFSVLEALDIEPDYLKDWYPEFVGKECRFAGKCIHDKEPECGVKDAVALGAIPKARYERYLELYKALVERKEKKYD